MTISLLWIIAIAFLASLVRSTLGFGESLIAVPLFLFFLPVHVAVPISVLLSITIAFIIVLQDHTKVHFKSARNLILYAIPGIPLGLVLLVYGNENGVKTGLGVLIILYSLFILFFQKSVHSIKEHKLLLPICGFLSGILGGAYGLNGPPLVIYGSLKGWSAKRFRATLQAYFFPVNLITLFAYLYKDLITAEVIHYYLSALISTIPAIFIGRYLNQQFKDGYFYKLVYWGLIIIGMLLIATALQ